MTVVFSPVEKQSLCMITPSNIVHLHLASIVENGMTASVIAVLKNMIICAERN